jgi:hypothetical protein
MIFIRTPSDVIYEVINFAAVTCFGPYGLLLTGSHLKISYMLKWMVKVKISLLQAVEAHRVARGRGSHIS